TRLIAWKTGRPFHPENMFFRTVDSGPPPAHALADFRVQFYAHKSLLDKMDETLGGSRDWAGHVLADYLHKILVLRNMHDKGGADIPIIVTAWDVARTKLAMDYWVDLSKGVWSEDERLRRYTECDAFCRRIQPCFPQTDLLVRALLADPAAEYVPPFIVFYSGLTEGTTCVLFTRPRHVPPPALVRGWPGACKDARC
ncbi:hypothetical protein B0H17DRAFT_863647, partial [Mycena rosella]